MEDLGLKVKFSKHAYNNPLGYGETAKHKAEDINEMFRCKEIDAIFCAMGGYNCNSVFDYLDFDLIKNNPKIICGYSDPTSLINMINAKTGLITFHGPNFKTLSSEETDYGYKEVVKRFINKDLSFGEYESRVTIDNEEHRVKEYEGKYKVINEGTAEGNLIGGNLCLFSNLITGKYAVDVKDKILFIEDFGFESSPGFVSNYLYKMKQNGVFEKIKGLWIGNYEHESGIALEKIVMDVLEDVKIPIVKSDNFGHGIFKTVIPIGAKVKIDTYAKEKVELVEEVVE